MRKARDGEATRETVINAAKEVFAERGFAGTSLAMISDKCGISDGLILHHFKNKENLYRQVQEHLAAEYFQVISQAAAGVQDVRMSAVETLRAAFRYWQEDTAYYRINLWAYLENQETLVEQESMLTTGLAEQVRQMQTAGQADARFSPAALLTMTIGPLHFWMRHREMFRSALNLPGSLQELDRDFEEQYIQLIMKVYAPAQADELG
jgi:AcrR family transcriptional regulator